MPEVASWSAGTVVVRREVLRGRVWAGMPMYVVADDPDLLALYMPVGTPMLFPPGPWPTDNGRHPWDRGPDSTWYGRDVLMLHRPGEAHSVWAMWKAPDRSFDGWYVNLQTPFERHRLAIDTFDHALDIVVAPDGTWRFKDLDDLEECEASGWFSTAEAEAIRREGDNVGRLLDDGDPWWDPGWAEWTPDPAMVEPAHAFDNWDR